MEVFYEPSGLPDSPYGYGLIDLLSLGSHDSGEVSWSHLNEDVDWTVEPPEFYLDDRWTRCSEADVIAAAMAARELDELEQGRGQ
jgi:hypothetical protein